MRLKQILRTKVAVGIADKVLKPLQTKDNVINATIATTTSISSTAIYSIVSTEKLQTDDSARKNNEFFMLLILSEWFVSHLFRLLKLDEIKNIDSVICQHENRCKWSEQLKKVELHISLDHSKYDHDNFEASLNWIVLKSFKIRELKLNFSNDGQHRLIPETFIKRITQNSPNMKKLVLKNAEITDLSLQDISNNCPNLESLVFEEMNEDSSEMLKIKCHQIKYFEISNLCYTSSDLDSETTTKSFKNLLRNNTKLETLSVSNMVTDYDIFKLLGRHCPLLKSVQIWLNYDEDLVSLRVIDEHIDIFTQGCHYLQSFCTNVHRFSCAKLFQSFGINNPYLEKIEIATNDVYDDIEGSQRVESIKPYLLEGLCKGCPLLKEFSCSDLSLSTQGLSYFTIFCPNIETINLERCIIADDGFTRIDKPNLKNLHSFSMIRMTDQCVANMVKTCGQNLKSLRLESCSQLNDASLKTIADHCPNLVRIVILEELSTRFTVGAVWGLCQTCKKLIDVSLIVNDNYFYPEGLVQALQQRRLYLSNSSVTNLNKLS